MSVEEVVSIALARCPNCKGRFRVLPCDILPRKKYSFTLIVHLVGEYDQGDKGLRAVVYGLLGCSPAHSTLHGWTEGLGAYVRGRLDGESPGGLPWGVVLEETARHVRGVRRETQRRRTVNARRYRSEERRLRLVAVAMFLAIGNLVGGVVEWHARIVKWLKGRPLAFRSARRCTAIEHLGADSSLRSGQNRSKRRKRWPIVGRSPPGDASR